jgi:hypothetical protein
MERCLRSDLLEAGLRLADYTSRNLSIGFPSPVTPTPRKARLSSTLGCLFSALLVTGEPGMN